MARQKMPSTLCLLLSLLLFVGTLVLDTRASQVQQSGREPRGVQRARTSSWAGERSLQIRKKKKGDDDDEVEDAQLGMPTDPPIEGPTDLPMDEPTDPPVDEATDPPVDESTDPPMDDDPTDPPMDSPTDPPMNSPTDPPMDSPTDLPVEEIPDSDEIQSSSFTTGMPSDAPSGTPSSSPSTAPPSETPEVSLGFEMTLLTNGTAVAKCVEAPPANGIVDTFPVDFIYSVYLDDALDTTAAQDRISILELQLHNAISENEMDCTYQSTSFDIFELSMGTADAMEGICELQPGLFVSPSGQKCYMVAASIQISLYYPARRRLELDSVLIVPMSKILSNAMAKLVQENNDIGIMSLESFTNPAGVDEGVTGDPTGGGESGPASAVDGNAVQQPQNTGPGVLGSSIIGVACVVFIVAVVAIAQRLKNRKRDYEEHIKTMRKMADDDSLYLVTMGRENEREKVRQMYETTIMEDTGDISRLNNDGLDSFFMGQTQAYDDESQAPTIPPDIAIIPRPDPNEI